MSAALRLFALTEADAGILLFSDEPAYADSSHVFAIASTGAKGIHCSQLRCSRDSPVGVNGTDPG